MEKIKRVLKKLKEKLSFRKESNQAYELSIPVAGVKKDEVSLNPDEGVIIINSLVECILVEEAERFRPCKMYNSFGFNRSIYLPDGIKVRELEMLVKDDLISIRQRV